MSEHDLHMLGVRCRVRVLRDSAGEIIRLEAVRADDQRRLLIESAAAQIAAGARVADLTLTAHALYDLLRELQSIRVQQP